MKKSTSSKGLLLEWLRKALNNQWYPGIMQWKDKDQEVFSIRWTHKSAEKWSEHDLAPFRDWAAHKGKLDGKNEKQLKATFRCALNSKKELKELGRERSLRLWKFIDPNSEEAKDNNTKTKKRKGGKLCENTSSPRTPRENTERTLLSDMSSLSIGSNIEDNVQSPCRLPAFESLSSPSFSPTPPHQALEISSNSPESKFSEDTFKTEEIFNLGSDLAHRVTTTCTSVNNIYTNSLQSPSSDTEYRTNYSPSPEHNCYSPPQSSSSPNSFHQTSTDLWQANCWQSTQSYQDISIFNQFFTNEFTELYKSANKELENNMKLEPMEMDQFVPVTHQVYNTNVVPAIDQVYSSNDQLHSINKIDRVNSQQDLANTDDYYLFSEEVDEEACSRIMLELERFSATPENRLYTYEN